jgi:GNAT superfamily N-acetyltransferase
VGDPRLEPLLADLVVEYGTRYGRPSAHTQLTEVPASDFVEPQGTFLIVEENGETIAGGALRQYDPITAEVKRVWTSHRHRRRGLARRVMAELEAVATELGYQRIHLTTGPRQPEAKNLYLAAGYTPRFDPTQDPETIGPLAFAKELAPGVGFAKWQQPTWEEVEEARRARNSAVDPDPEVGNSPQPAAQRITRQQRLVDVDNRRHVHAKLVTGLSR